MRKSLPDTGADWPTLDARMTEMAEGDIDWRRGRTPLYVFYATDSVYRVGRDAFMKFFTENALGGKRAFFSLKRMEEEIVDMALGLFHAPAEACGAMTTGGSESIFLAVRTCRDWTRANRPRIAKPNIVAPYSAHPAFDKAGQTMDIEVRRVSLRADLRADPAAMAAALDDDTMMLVGSAPCFPHGVIDPIAELSRLAETRGLWLHVDACVGGYLAPFAKKLGYPIPDFDFALPGVVSLSADLHKFGFCPKPASTVFYRSADHFRHQIFDFDGWPNGRFTTATLTGTRAGGAVAAAWAVMHHLGEQGYLAVADRLLRLVRAYADGIRAIDGLHLWGEPDLSILSFGSDQIDIFAAAERMGERGWLPGLTQRPRGMHLMLSMLHEPARQDYLADLAAAVAEVKAGTGAPAKIQASY
jgi:glutamate/tyrosine decarboxylase-like PLP-dependent enzyme